MKNKGITLIALVITIIILLILAGISVALITGNNGILTKATTVELEYSKAEIEEAIGIKVNDKLIEAYGLVNPDLSEDISKYFNESSLISAFTDNTDRFMTAYGSDTVSDVTGTTTVSKVYVIAPLKLSDKVDLYGKGEYGTGDVFTLEVVTTTDESGTEKSTGQYELKYYDENNTSELISTISLYKTNNS